MRKYFIIVLICAACGADKKAEQEKASVEEKPKYETLWIHQRWSKNGVRGDSVYTFNQDYLQLKLALVKTDGNYILINPKKALK